MLINSKKIYLFYRNQVKIPDNKTQNLIKIDKVVFGALAKDLYNLGQSWERLYKFYLNFFLMKKYLSISKMRCLSNQCAAYDDKLYIGIVYYTGFDKKKYISFWFGSKKKKEF